MSMTETKSKQAQKLHKLELGPGDLVFDVGACVGDKTAEYLAVGARVVAFEPNPLAIRKFQKRYGRCVTLVTKAMGASVRKGTLSVCPKAPTISTLSEEWKHGRFSRYEWTQDVPVDVTTLDEAIREFGIPDFVKIDVEGYEYEVLCGLTQVVPSLSFEFAGEFIDLAIKCIKRLRDLCFSRFALGLGKNGKVTFSSNIEGILEERSEKEWGDVYAYP